jgi:PAS domain S-box-containing protein
VTADRALANALPQIIWCCDAQGRLQWVNDRWFELTGLSEAETLVNKGALVAIHPDDRGEIARHWAHALETSCVTEFEYRIRAVSGEYRWHVARAAPVRGAGGEITGWIAAVFDIHDRRTAEEARRASARQFDSFFHLNSLPMAITRRSDGAYLFVNDAFTTLTGYSRDEAIGRTPMELGMLSAETRVAAAAHFSGGTGRSFEMRVRMRDGRQAMLMLFNSHIEIDGAPCFLNTGLDVTQQRAMENALRESEAQANAASDALRRANQQKDEFLAMLGHELRNPLAPLLTATELMALNGSGVMEEERKMIEDQVKHLMRLVDDLLDVSRITRGSIELRKEPIALSRIVVEAVEMASPLFEQRSHRISIDVAPNLIVEADPARMVQVVANLLTNAARYTDNGGDVRVRSEATENTIVLRVTDTGIGISPAILPLIFDPFVQEKQEFNRPRGGLGLGLAIVRSLMELHGGSVSASSPGPGRGSEFAISLPRSRQDVEAQAKGPAVATERHANGTGIRVLVVDDNEKVARALARGLEALGHEVRTAPDGPAALRLLEHFTPALCLIDLGLPVMDGYELARRLGKMPSLAKTRIVAVSGYGEPGAVQRSAEAGFAAHLVKPVELAMLEKIARDAGHFWSA